jgi:amino acid transporter
VINSVIGSSIFGLPSELTRLLGSASVLAVVLGGLATAVVMACLTEVASQFKEAGGAYLYARTTFGSFVGVQVGWFSWLTRVASAAAAASLFGDYLQGLAPALATGIARTTAMAMMLVVLVLMNYMGVKNGATVSTATLIARLVPLAVLIAFGLPPIVQRSSAAQMLAVGGHRSGDWFEALLLISFLYGGYETAMMALGEVKEPRKMVPFALAVGLLTCILLYSLCQWVVVVTIGASATPRPLAEAAVQVLGPKGALLISLAALISTVGYLSACVLNVPRLMFAISEYGDFPRWFSQVHPRFYTPHVAIVVFGAVVFLMGATGSFRWAVALSAGARLITYGSVCAAVIPLRRRQQKADGVRIPLGPVFSMMGVLMALVMIVRVHQREALVLLATAAIAGINWLIVRRRKATASAATIMR